jgi:hypothetical protein
MNQHILEKLQIVSGFVPIGIGSTRAGDYVSMKGYGRCTIVFFCAAGPAGDDPVITVTQATAVAPSNAKALNFTRIDTKQGADLTAVGTFTTVMQAAANTYTDATSAEVQKIWVIDIKAEDLDVDNGYDCVAASIADAGTATQIGCLLYLLHEPRYASGTLPSAIVN